MVVHYFKTWETNGRLLLGPLGAATAISYLFSFCKSGLEKVLQPGSQPLRRSQNQLPTKNALKIHDFKGSRKFRLRVAVKLFPGQLHMCTSVCGDVLPTVSRPLYAGCEDQPANSYAFRCGCRVSSCALGFFCRDGTGTAQLGTATNAVQDGPGKPGLICVAFVAWLLQPKFVFL